MIFHANGKYELMKNNFRYSAWMINALIFSLPIFTFFYLQYGNKVDIQSHHRLFVVFVQLLSFAGLMMLHRRYKEIYSKLSHSVFQLLTINELFEKIRKNISAKSLIQIMLEKAMAVSNSQIGSVFKFEPENNRFCVVASKGLKGGLEDFYINVEDSLVNCIVVDKKPLLVQNMEADSRINKINNPKYGPPSFLSMPIFVKEKLFGVLNLSCKETKEAYGPYDEKIMAIITGEIGLALENTRLHAKNKKVSRGQKKNFEKTICTEELFGQKISAYKRAGRLSLLGEIVENIAQEVKNPINDIISYAEILKDRFSEQCQDVDISDRIIKKGDRVAKIVNSILSFAQCQKEECCPANIRDIICDTLSLVKSLIIKNDIKFSVDIPSDLIKVKVRRKEIQQVFLDIIDNACFALNQRFPKFSEYKFFELKSDTVEVDNRKYIRTIFHDGGIGIPETTLNNIWDPFFSTKPEGEGTGLGLAISKAIIINHGGRIWVESVENQYTKVIVDLPTYKGWEITK